MTDTPKRTKEDSLRGVIQPLPIVLQLFFTKLRPISSRKLHEISASQIAQAMSYIFYNGMEPNGFTPTQFVNVRPKCICAGVKPCRCAMYLLPFTHSITITQFDHICAKFTMGAKSCANPTNCQHPGMYVFKGNWFLKIDVLFSILQHGFWCQLQKASDAHRHHILFKFVDKY